MAGWRRRSLNGKDVAPAGFEGRAPWRIVWNPALAPERGNLPKSPSKRSDSVAAMGCQGPFSGYLTTMEREIRAKASAPATGNAISRLGRTLPTSL